MNVVLDLPDQLQAELTAEATRAGLSLSDYAVRLLSVGRGVGRPVTSGLELLDYWESEGLIGSRPEITDSAAHARILREKVEHRSLTET